MLKRKTEKRRIKLGIRLATLISSAVMLLSSIAVWAWLNQGRTVASVGEISNPTSIFINAANVEDIRYLDLSGIDVNVDNHKDFIFCVRGDNVSTYGLQLGYTTNNQFGFEIYYGKTANSSTPGAVSYKTHPDVGNSVTQYYAVDTTKGASGALGGSYLNKKSEILAYTGSEVAIGLSENLHSNTYGTYSNVNQYAEPIYWQSIGIETTPDEHNLFCDYFILRVTWDQNVASNNKETDIIYIAAKNIGG